MLIGPAAYSQHIGTTTLRSQRLSERLAKQFRFKYREMHVGQDEWGHITVTITWLNGSIQCVTEDRLNELQPPEGMEKKPDAE